jgi:hypothetical protein
MMPKYCYRFMTVTAFRVCSYLWVVLCASNPNIFHSALKSLTQNWIILNHYTHTHTYVKVCVLLSVECTGTVHYLKVLFFLLKKLGFISPSQYAVWHYKWYFHSSVIKILYIEACGSSFNGTEFVLLIFHWFFLGGGLYFSFIFYLSIYYYFI